MMNLHAITWSTAAPAIGAAFFASLVEVVEAFTIVLAAALWRGWRPALLGAAAALALLAVAVAVLGPLLAAMPVRALQLAIGVLLLLMGMNWLRKACLRHAGIIPLHDEAAIFAAQSARLGAGAGSTGGRLDWQAALTALQAVLIEGIEVIFIVIAVGAGGGLLLPASGGAAAACVLVLAAGAALRRPLARVPENALKFGVGVMLSAFGVFWTGEGLGTDWPGHDLALPIIAVIFLLAGLAGSALARGTAGREAAQ